MATSASNGVGFIVASPGQGIANNTQTGWFTTSVYAGSVIVNPIAVPDNGVRAFTTNSDYNAASFAANGVNFRLVSACVKICYTGTTLNEAGTVYSLVEPDHQSLFGFTTANLAAYASCTKTAVTKEWTEIVYTGRVVPIEEQYQYQFAGLVPNEQPIMAFMITSPSGTSLPFDYEFWANYEVIGPNVAGKTASLGDSVGYAAFTSALQDATATGQVGAHHGSSDFMMSVGSSLSRIISTSLSFVSHPSNLRQIGGAVMAQLVPYVLGSARVRRTGIEARPY